MVYEIDESDVEKLDGYEGYKHKGKECEGCKNYYSRKEYCVYLEDGTCLLVQVYMACKQNDPNPPSANYLPKIVDGAKHWGLPSDYVCELENKLKRIEACG